MPTGWEQQYSRTGRPSVGLFCDPETGEFDEEGKELIKRASGLGLPRKAIAALLGMSPKTFENRRQKFPEIEEWIEEGSAAADLAVSNALYKRAVQGDMAAIRWYEMTRTQRNPNVPVVEQSNVYVIEAPATQSEEEWEQAYSPVTLEHDGGDSSPATA